MKTTSYRREYGAGIVGLAGSLIRQPYLLRKLLGREVTGRYRGSMLGIFWSLLNPLLMLAVYTFVFGVIFGARWGGALTHGGGGTGGFALNLFAGLIVHGLFAETATKAPHLVAGNVQYVKKVIFPLEILPWVTIGAALVHWLIGFFVLLGFALLVQGQIAATVLLAPLVMAPFVLLLAGMAWILAVIGVYFRDINQVIGVAVTVMLFLAPVFYPLSAIPEGMAPWVYLNPLTVIIEELRRVALAGLAPRWNVLAVYALVSLAVAWGGFAFFQKARRSFPDVL